MYGNLEMGPLRYVEICNSSAIKNNKVKLKQEMMKKKT